MDLFEIIMRKLFAALACAVAHVPQLIYAESAFPGPADASASVPAVTVPPAFAGYHRYDDSDAVEWIRLNRALAPGRGESVGPSRSTPQGRAASHDHAGHVVRVNHAGHTDSIGRVNHTGHTGHQEHTQ
ncbi:hypothetical protein KQH49_06005 [Mycetohabitans sp. B5]|uniref:hypothetical protein n=1 Tax=Mycetohabitans TaxID=2571159 RepID=UPI0011AFF085|nr:MULTISPECIES: hypothetical protein [Mycetohabitans]MCG1054536.1 hypothetical protein [Mycetohabitans sp. B5]